MEEFKWACQNGDMDAIDKCIANGANVNHVFTRGTSLLHFAADYGQSNVIEKLLQHGADIHKQDENGITVLLAAIFEGHTECVKLLLEKGAKKDGTFAGQSYVEHSEKEEITNLLK